MKDLMFVHVFDAASFCSHSHMAALNFPDAFKWYNTMSLLSLRSEMIPALVSPFIAFSTLLKYFWRIFLLGVF
jgi:hypothetical protein